MKRYTLEDLKNKTDAEFYELFGYDRQVAEFKDTLSEAEKLPPKGKEKVEDRLNEMLSPRIYPEDLKYTVESAKRKEQSGKEALCDCSPASVLD